MKLEELSGLSAEEAKERLIESLKDEAKTDAASYINEIIDEASVDINEVMENLLEVEWDLNTLEEEDARKIHQPV